MGFKWLGPMALLAALFIGDQIRLNRPAHKYRLSIEVTTPQGVKTASGVFAVHPYRGYSSGGMTRTKGDALFVDLGDGKNLVALLAHGADGSETDGINYVALRAYRAAGSNVSFSNVGKMTGQVPVPGELIPVLASFADVSDPKSARLVRPDDLQAVLGAGTSLRGISVDVIPNGMWPLDFGGPLGEPVTRDIAAKLPWWNGTEGPAIAALQAAGLKTGGDIDAKQAFTRK